MKRLAVCPYCKAEINSVHVTVKEIAFTHYEVSVSEKYIGEWHETSKEVDSQELYETRCPHCQRKLPLYSEREINEFLAGSLIIAQKSEVRYTGGPIVGFNGYGYEIYEDVGDCLLLRPCSWVYNFFIELFRF